jgi:phage shock protein C
MKMKEDNETKDEVKRLYRSRENKVLAGVCGGIAEYFNVDPVWIRLVTVLLMFADGVGFLVYLIAWILIPINPYQAEPSDKDKARKSGRIDRARDRMTRVSGKIEKKAERLDERFEAARKEKRDSSGRFLLGGLIVLFGVGLLLKNLVSWFKFGYIWPIAVIAVGIFLLTRRSK